jgi:hypothetical protein
VLALGKLSHSLPEAAMVSCPNDRRALTRSTRRRAAKRSAWIASSLLATFVLAGCVVAPLPPPQVAVQPGPVVVAPMAPPLPLAETVVVAPGPGYVWLGGYWSWTGGRHLWTPGHWAPHHPGYRWVPRQWEYGPGGWHQRGGHWGR